MCIACMLVCLFVCLFACLLVCLLVCLFACLLVCLFACLLVCLFACLFICLFVYLFLCIWLICLCACLVYVSCCSYLSERGALLRKCANQGMGRQGVALKRRNCLQEGPTPCRPTPVLVQLRIVLSEAGGCCPGFARRKTTFRSS